MRAAVLAVFAAVTCGPAHAQDLGIRAGVAVLSPAMVRTINSQGPLLLGSGIPPSFPVMTQVGAERRFSLGPPGADGATAELSFVGLAGGIERRALILSGHALLSIQTETGLRVGAGPALSLTDLSVAIAVGRELRAGRRYRTGGDALLELTTGGIRLSVLASLTERRW